MKKLKIVLQSNKIFYIFLLVSLLYTFIYVNLYDYKVTNQTKYTGYISDYSIDGDKLSLIIKSKDKIKINYYFNSKKEKEKFNLSYGDYIDIYGKAEKPSENTNFKLFNYRNYLLSKKIKYEVLASNIKLKRKNKNIFFKLKISIIKSIEKRKNTKNYLKAFIIGDKNEIEKSFLDSYKFLGISHLLAISGMHISLISILIFKLIKKRLPNFSYLIVSIILLFYLFLTNFTISMVRACLEFILFSINKVFKFNIKNTNIVILLLCVLLLYNPYFIFDIGFRFSFSISYSLMLFRPIIDKEKRYIIKSLLISVISFLVSIPILINSFNQINILSIIYNIFYVPFISYIIFPMGLLTLIFPYLDATYIYFINIFENITMILSKIKILSFDVSNIPIILCILYYIFIYFLITKFNKKKIIILFLIFIIFINYKRYSFNAKVTFIDVSQGDSILIRLKDKNVLIDTGGKINYKVESWRKRKSKNNITNYTLIPYLKKDGVKKIDYLILTHGDFDHMGESINLVNNFKIEKVIFNCGKYNNLEEILINVLNKKKIPYYNCVKRININENILYFLNDNLYDNENDNSNVIYTKINNYKFIFMGDVTMKVENNIIENYKLNNIDVLKVGHHGSKTSSSKKFIESINPKYSIISVGKNNKYGHPNKETLENLKNSKIYRTDKNGGIMFNLKNNKLKIKTCFR